MTTESEYSDLLAFRMREPLEERSPEFVTVEETVDYLANQTEVADPAEDEVIETAKEHDSFVYEQDQRVGETVGRIQLAQAEGGYSS